MPVIDHITPSDKVRMVTRDTKLREAAQYMKQHDTGILPVHNGDKLTGIVTDRDMVLRGLAAGQGEDATVGDVMTDRVLYVYDDEECEAVIANMEKNAVRRMPVVDRDKNFKGMISITDMCADHRQRVGEALAVIHDKPPQS